MSCPRSILQTSVALSMLLCCVSINQLSEMGFPLMQGATSGTWQRHQLYLATPTSVQLVFVATDTPGAEPFIEVGSLKQPSFRVSCINGLVQLWASIASHLGTTSVS